MQFIDTRKKLRNAIDIISRADRIALDTEADSLHHYFEKLCLLQISVPDEDFVIDPLTGIDLAELVKVIQKKPLICHGADFDIRLLKRFYSFNPKEVFDTMLAAQFLGYPRPSLQSLVEKYFRVHLSKANQKADWSKRPLTPSMVEYAINDTMFLHRIRSILEKELEEAGRLEWFRESCHALLLSTDRKKEVDPDKVWRIKGSKDLKDHELVVLKELWHWRDKDAQDRDRPRFKVMSPEQMIRITRWVVQNPDKDVKHCSAVPSAFNNSRVSSLSKAMKRALGLPIESIIAVKKPQSKREAPRFSNKQREMLKALKEVRKKFSTKYKCDPSLFANNAVLEAIVISKATSIDDFKKKKILLHWQADVIGNSFLDILKKYDDSVARK